MNGRIIYESDPNYGEGGEGMSFGALMKVKSDGELKREHDRITVKNATYLVIYSAFATNYNVQTFDFDENIDYRAIIRDQMSKVENLCYCDVKAKHIEDHQKWFCNVKFELDAPVICEPSIPFLESSSRANAVLWIKLFSFSQSVNTAVAFT